MKQLCYSSTWRFRLTKSSPHNLKYDGLCWGWYKSSNFIGLFSIFPPLRQPGIFGLLHSLIQKFWLNLFNLYTLSINGRLSVRYINQSLSSNTCGFWWSSLLHILLFHALLHIHMSWLFSTRSSVHESLPLNPSLSPHFLTSVWLLPIFFQTSPPQCQWMETSLSLPLFQILY